MKLITWAATFALAAAPLAAAELASGSEIMATISGNTVQGGMADGTAYTEFYQADGTIKGAGYSGMWTVEENKMCFEYGEGATCWGVVIDGDMVTWMNGDVPEGTGTVVAGNPNGF